MERTVGPHSPSVTFCRTTHTLEGRAQSRRGSVPPSSAAVKGAGLQSNLRKSDNAAGKKGAEIPDEIRQRTEVGDRAPGLAEAAGSERSGHQRQSRSLLIVMEQE